MVDGETLLIKGQRIRLSESMRLTDLSRHWHIDAVRVLALEPLPG